jgi:hypothetical protein
MSGSRNLLGLATCAISCLAFAAFTRRPESEFSQYSQFEGYRGDIQPTSEFTGVAWNGRRSTVRSVNCKESASRRSHGPAQLLGRNCYIGDAGAQMHGKESTNDGSHEKDFITAHNPRSVQPRGATRL